MTKWLILDTRFIFPLVLDNRRQVLWVANGKVYILNGSNIRRSQSHWKLGWQARLLSRYTTIVKSYRSLPRSSSRKAQRIESVAWIAAIHLARSKVLLIASVRKIMIDKCSSGYQRLSRTMASYGSLYPI